MFCEKIKKLKESLSQREEKELKIHREKLNFDRCLHLSYLTIALGFLVFIVYYLLFKELWDTIPGYKYLFYIHLSYLISLLIYYCLLYMIKFFNFKKRIFKKIILYYYITVTLLWCIAMAVNAEVIHNHISAYIIIVFAIAYFVRFNFIESSVFIGGSFLIFIIASFLYNNNHVEVFSYVMNSLVCVVLAYSVSMMNYYWFIVDFINKKTLNKKNRQLENQIKMKTIFLGNISHELKTPLNLIYSAEQMLKLHLDKEIKELETKDKSFKYLKIIRQNSFRLIRLINNIIDSTKMNIDKYKMNFQNIDIINVINQIIQSLTIYVEEKGVNINLLTDLDKKVIACDPDAIERILLNLISNAVKYTPVDGNIDISVYMKDEYLVISVKDSGAGIPEEVQKNIFERFVQADDDISKKSGGSGIGLSLVRYLVLKHQGSIDLNSKPGKGSEFIIRLPDRVVDNPIDSSPVNNQSNISKEQIVQNIQLEFSDI
ncbi:MAG: sensor histidine kinase, partial [bacterium]